MKNQEELFMKNSFKMGVLNEKRCKNIIYIYIYIYNIYG
jgi:hypothetical protein